MRKRKIDKMKREMKNKVNFSRASRLFSFLISLVLLVSICYLSLSFTSAQEVNYCCEKTTSGAWCQNAPQSQCDLNFKNAPTSCDSTSYCKKGCCFDSQEGLCMESTPQRVCSDTGGTWADNAQCNIVQCNLGCCLIGDQGAFVTLTRCKELSGFYGLKTDFRATITDEVTCVATAQGADKGACVTEDPATLSKVCVFTTRASCSVGNINTEVNITGNNSNNTVASVGFYKDVLCSAEELGSICGPSQKTTLVDGKDEVYYLDTCGNIANIYDSNRYDDEEYWKNVYEKSESCGYGQSNANSKTCGNCDYYYGSIGKKATGILGRPVYGDYICADLSCKDVDGEDKRHGESWCVADSPNGEGQDTVGSRYFKEICINNEVLTEPCADYRNEICIQGDFNGFTEAACRVNRWQDCTSQVEQGDCENYDVRDCMWVDGYYFSQNSGQIEKTNNDSNKGALTPEGLCVPYYPPGFNFWGSSSSTGGTSSINSATSSTGSSAFNATTPSFGTGYVNPATAQTSDACSLGNAQVTFEWKKETRSWPFNDEALQCANDECNKYVSDPTKGELTDEEAAAWAKDMNAICANLGDCGGKTNWVGVYTEDGYAAYKDSKRVAGAGGSEILESSSTKTTTGAGTTGKVVSDMLKNMFNK